ncbi:hypothetical protein GW17_00022114 [Ensete ventricosum]|nr:hypothetical protein GW17_00022114 [Ensete ventricosum]
MLNSAKRDRIFFSMQLSKASNFALIASSAAMVYASRSIILRSSGRRLRQKARKCSCSGVGEKGKSREEAEMSSP